MALVARTRHALLELQDIRTLCMCMTQSSPLNRCVCLLVCIYGLHDTICLHSWLHDTCCLHSWPASYKLSNKVFHLKAVSEFRKVDSHSFLLSVVQFLLLC